jgi:hypothetical protein
MDVLSVGSLSALGGSATSRVPPCGGMLILGDMLGGFFLWRIVSQVKSLAMMAE